MRDTCERGKWGIRGFRGVGLGVGGEIEARGGGDKRRREGRQQMELIYSF